LLWISTSVPKAPVLEAELGFKIVIFLVRWFDSYPHKMMRHSHSLLSRHPLFQLASAFAAGIVCAERSQVKFPHLLLAFAAASVLTIVATCFARLGIARLALLTAIVLAGTCLAFLQSRTPPNQIGNLIDRGLVVPDERVELLGTVTGPVEFAKDGVHLSLRVQHLKTRTESMECSGAVALNGYFKGPSDEKRYRELEIESGARVTLRTKLDRTEQYRNPGVATLAEYLDTKGLDAIAEIGGPESISVDSSAHSNLSATLYRWRAFLQQQFDSYFSTETAAVLSAALLGNRYNLSAETSDRFREGGTFHILVISGAHISFLGAMVLLITRRLISRRWLQLVAAATVVWLYTIAVGADVSVVRAAFMFSFVAAGQLLFRTSSPLNSMGAAALVLLAWSPKDIFDPSLQLTFLSVLAIIAVAWPILKTLDAIGRWRPSRLAPYPPACSPPIRALAEILFWSEADWTREQVKLSHSYHLFKSPIAIWLEQWHLQRIVRYLFVTVAVSTSVQVVLLPLQILYFHRLSLSAMVLNIVVGILLAVLAAFALLAVLLVQVSATLAAPLITLANAIDWLMVRSVDPFTRLGVGSMRVAEYAGPARVIYVVYYLPVAVFALLLTRWRPVGRSSTKEQGHKFVLLAVVQVVMFGLLICHPFSKQGTHGELRMDFLDVGQGDSALLTMPDGATLLIDGGGKPQFLHDASAHRRRSIGETVVCEYLWYRGLDTIDYVLATHADADHIEGLNDVLTNFKVRSALVGRTPSGDAEFAKFAQTLRARAVPLQILQAGDVLRFGDIQIDVLWPPNANADAPSRNNDSVVLRLRFGQRTILFTGDIEKAAEQFLSTSDQLCSDVVKVPHHGSRTSSTEAFVTAVQPELAVISVGQKSMFGHPHREVVERWQAIGAEVLTTGRSGMITVTTDGNSLRVEKFIQ
jgi:competence protein ComEC